MNRGVIAETMLGQNLPSSFKGIDIFTKSVATSIKSLDLHAKTYQKIPKLRYKVTKYIDEVAAFKGADWAGVCIKEEDIRGRSLKLILPKGASKAQQEVLKELVQYGKKHKITVEIVIWG